MPHEKMSYMYTTILILVRLKIIHGTWLFYCDFNTIATWFRQYLTNRTGIVYTLLWWETHDVITSIHLKSPSETRPCKIAYTRSVNGGSLTEPTIANPCQLLSIAKDERWKQRENHIYPLTKLLSIVLGLNGHWLAAHLVEWFSKAVGSHPPHPPSYRLRLLSSIVEMLHNYRSNNQFKSINVSLPTMGISRKKNIWTTTLLRQDLYTVHVFWFSKLWIILAAKCRGWMSKDHWRTVTQYVFVPETVYILCYCIRHDVILFILTKLLTGMQYIIERIMHVAV